MMEHNEIDTTTYAKLVKVGKNVVRVETKDADDLDSWPTYVGEMVVVEAEAMAAAHNWNVIASWRDALKLEGWTQPWPRSSLV